jgi:aminopeptidase-like protein
MFPYDEYLHKLWPICRSITGDGVRQSLAILSQLMPLKQLEFPSGEKCFDWTIPKEWNIREAWIKDSKGNKVIDFAENNLHVLSYSHPVHKKISYEQLQKNLHSIVDNPDAIPYRTSYYQDNWGFCLSENQRKALNKDEEYEVYIDSSLTLGSLTLGEAYLPGESSQEILLSSYICHPSMANNELSGPLVLAHVYQKLKALPKRKYAYRFLLGPETIGAIVYLSQNFDNLKNTVVSGLHFAMLGNDANFHFSKTRQGNALIDRAAMHILKQQNNNKVIEWTPVGGGDQRQYCSVGINLPIAYLTRAWQGNFANYHTSLDNLDSLSITKLEQAAETIFSAFKVLELNNTYINTKPYCEPQLGKYGLYNFKGGEKISNFVLQVKYLLGYCDGNTDLLTIAERMNTTIFELEPIVDILVAHNLLAIK